MSLHCGEGKWSPRLLGVWDLTLRSTRDSSRKAEPASCRADEQKLSKNGVGFWHCTERRVQVKEGSIHTGMADVSHQCSEPRGIQMGTTEHDQKVKQPRPSGRRHPILVSVTEGWAFGRAHHISAQHRHQLCLWPHKGFLPWEIDPHGGEGFLLYILFIRYLKAGPSASL